MPDVESSMIRSVEHDGQGLMRVTFTSGERYDYEGVPRKLYDQFLAAPSKGQFFNDRIRGAFSFARVIGRRVPGR